MKTKLLILLGASLCFSHGVQSSTWKYECVGYYKISLPKDMEVAVYPIKGFLEPKPRPEDNGFFVTRRYAGNGITFGDEYDRAKTDTVQAQFSSFYYSNYRLGISSKNTSAIDFGAYRIRRLDAFEFGKKVARQKEELDLNVLEEPMTEKTEFLRKHNRILKDYTNAFVSYSYRGYTIYINSGTRLYHFWRKNDKDYGKKSQTAEAQIQKSESEVLSLLNRFRPRELYEVPTEQGFCFPYGFIAADSGQEPRNIGVTYRLKNHPDVTIFFQDLGMKPEAGKEDDMNEKDYVTWLWTWQYQWSAVSKKLLKPKWRKIEMDGRKGVGTFVKSTYKDGSLSYGYVAYVKGDRSARNLNPDLLLYVMQDSQQAKDNPPMGKDELEKMAEIITSSIRRR